MKRGGIFFLLCLPLPMSDHNDAKATSGLEKKKKKRKNGEKKKKKECVYNKRKKKHTLPKTNLYIPTIRSSIHIRPLIVSLSSWVWYGNGAASLQCGGVWVRNCRAHMTRISTLMRCMGKIEKERWKRRERKKKKGK
jgi:hypothetical protein